MSESARGTFEAQSAALLRREREHITAQMQDLRSELDSIIEASEDVALDDEHDPDGATVGYERAKAAAMLSRNEIRLQELDQAEQRLREGTYGRCEGCGQQIAIERLQALPSTTTCLGCLPEA